MYTKGLVNADRASLFLVDEEKQEMYADYFDDGKVDEENRPVFEKKAQIRYAVWLSQRWAAQMVKSTVEYIVFFSDSAILLHGLVILWPFQPPEQLIFKKHFDRIVEK